jgi:hypothetical protein
MNEIKDVGHGAHASFEAKVTLPTAEEFGFPVPIMGHCQVNSSATNSDCGPQYQCLNEAMGVLPATDEGADVALSTDHLKSAPSSILSLIALQARRRHLIKLQVKVNNSTAGFVRSLLGFRTDMPEVERKKLVDRATKIVAVASKGDPGKLSGDDLEAFRAALPMVEVAREGLSPFDRLRRSVELEMRRISRKLPVWEAWGKDVCGFGDLGLGIIVGETGDLSNYTTIEKLWKRLGLAVFDGKRQGKRTDPDEAALHGYNPCRRAEIWTIADSMFRHQWAGAKDDEAAHPKGRYGEAYAKRKAATEGRDWTLMHREQDARRVMCKVFIEDLWKVWGGVSK